MADEEPTHGELARRLDALRDDLRLMIPGLIGRAEYVADQRGVDQRFTVLSRGLDEARNQHAEDVRALNERITSNVTREDEDKQSWRNALWVGLLPAMAALLVGVAGIIVSIYLARH